MVYLVATMANDAELMPALLFSLRGQVAVPDTPLNRETWGVGYFGDGRPLIVRKPAASLEERSTYGAAPDLRSRVIISCAQPALVQAEVPPFRFRQWLFGYVGDLSHVGGLQSKLAPKFPDFVRDMAGAEHEGRLVQGMFLTELHRAGLLEDPLADAHKVGAALERTTEMLVRLGPEAGIPEIKAAFVASNGRTMVVTRLGYPLWIRQIDGLERLPEGPVDEDVHDFKQIIAALKRFRAFAIAKDVESEMSPWRSLHERGTTVVDSALNIHDL